MMSKKSKTENCSLTSHPHYAEYSALSWTDRHRLEVLVPYDKWKVWGREPAAEAHLKNEAWTAEERDLVTRGLLVCPSCNGRGWYRTVVEATAHPTKDRTVNMVKESTEVCKCAKWQHIWNLTKQSLPSEYHYVNLWTLKSNSRSRLPKEIQNEEIEYLRQYNENGFFFIGPSGTGKTTFSSALLRDAFERKENEKHFWKPLIHGVSTKKSTWIWRSNFNTLLQQYNAKQKEGWEGDKVDSPDVTEKQIYDAFASGHRPVLVLEELDKLELNAHRVNYLNSLIDAILTTRGQLVVTSNLNIPELITALNVAGESKGEPLVRRLTQTLDVRNYFEYCKG